MGGSHSKYSIILSILSKHSIILSTLSKYSIILSILVFVCIVCYVIFLLILVSKYLFKVSCSIPEISRHSHTLQACSDYNKKAWTDAFSLAKSQFQQQPQFQNSLLEPIIEQSQSNTIL